MGRGVRGDGRAWDVWAGMGEGVGAMVDDELLPGGPSLVPRAFNGRVRVLMPCAPARSSIPFPFHSPRPLPCHRPIGELDISALQEALGEKATRSRALRDGLREVLQGILGETSDS